RRVILVGAEREGVVDGPVGFRIGLKEVEVLLDLDEIGCGRERRARRADGDAARKSFLALSAGIEITPDAEVERKGAKGRPNTGIDVDFRGCVIGKGDALDGGADVKLQILAY